MFQSRRIGAIRDVELYERAHAHVGRDRLPGDHGRLHGPVHLQLPAGLGLAAHRRSNARVQRAARAEIVAQDRDLPGIPSGLQLPPDHHRVPHLLGQKSADHRPIRIQQAAAAPTPQCWRGAPLHRSAHRFGLHSELLGNVAKINTTLDQCYLRPTEFVAQCRVLTTTEATPV